MVVITGNADGSSAVDYTVNPSTGFPLATGPRNLAVPFNHLLPAWDAVTGTLAAAALLAAERHRQRTGEGQLIKIALSDVAFAMVGNLGKIAEVQINHNDRQKDGNFLYGAFGRDFATEDGRRVMIVGLTFRQWKGLVDAGSSRRSRRSRRCSASTCRRRATGSPRARSRVGALGVGPRPDARGDRADLRRERRLLGYQTFTQLVEEDPGARRPTRCSRWSTSRGRLLPDAGVADRLRRRPRSRSGRRR